MPTQAPEPAFSHERYSRASRGIASVFSSLPQDAVRSLAEEALVRVAAAAERPSVTPPSHGEQIEQLCMALIAADPGAGGRFVAEIRDAGTTVEDLYLDYLAPAARRLGDWWSDDEVSFLDVTLGAGRIFAIMRALQADGAPRPVGERRSAIFASVPGDTHTLGVRMAADLFRRHGWDIELGVDLAHDELVRRVSDADHRLVGLSAGSGHAATALARLILALRISAPRALILVSGQILEDAADVVEAMGPDATAIDIGQAEAMLDRFAGRQAARPTP